MSARTRGLVAVALIAVLTGALAVVVPTAGAADRVAQAWREAEAWEAKRQWSLAMAALHEVLEHEPKNAEALYRLGRLREKIGAREMAEQAYRDALAADPAHAGARGALEGLHYSAGIKAQAAGKDDALAAFQRAAEANPESATTQLALGEELARRGDLAGAATAFGTAARLAPEDATAHAQLGAVLARQGRHAEAAAAYERAVKADERDAAAHHELGLVYRTLGRRADAITELGQAIRWYMFVGNEVKALEAERIEQQLIAERGAAPR